MNKDMTSVLRELVVSLHGEHVADLLDELSEVAIEIMDNLKLQRDLPPDKIDRYHEILRELYPERYEKEEEES